MKLRYQILLFLIMFVGIQLGEEFEPVIRVKAVGLAPYWIQPRSRARAAALRAAKAEGYKKLAETGGSSIRLQLEEYTHTIADSYLKNVRLIRTHYLSDYKVEVVMDIKKKDFYHVYMVRIKKEIESIETQISTQHRNLENLKKLLSVLEKKIKREGD